MDPNVGKLADWTSALVLLSQVVRGRPSGLLQ